MYSATIESLCKARKCIPCMQNTLMAPRMCSIAVQYIASALVYSVAPEYIPGIANVFDYDGILMQYPIGIPSLSNTILALANVFCLSRIHY